MHISVFKDKHKGQTAWIIGRGISLRNLAPVDIGDGFIIAINQSIAQIDALNLPNMVYSMYSYGCEIYPKEDKQKAHVCRREIVLPKRNAPILIDDTPGEGNNCLLDYPQRYGYFAETDLGISSILASAATSIFVAKYLGANEIKMLCFDAYTDMDLRAIGPIGETQKIDAAYIGQRKQIEWAIGKTEIPTCFIKPLDKTPRPSMDSGVLIGTCMHGNQNYRNYTHSLAYTFGGFYKANIPIDTLMVSDNCFVDAARNYIFTRFLETTYKKLFFIDADIGWDFRAFLEMYLSKEDFIGGAAPHRNQWDKFSGNLCEPKIEKDGLFKAIHISTSFLCISKKACLEIVKKFPEYYRKDGRSVYDVFRMDRENGIFIGEDYAFCNRYAATGGQMWIYPDVTISHYGSNAYVGNYKEHLKGPSLNKLFDEFGSDKGNVAHQYGRFYESKLSKFNGDRLNLLEIGLSITGEKPTSLDAWKKYFKNVYTVGFDIVNLEKFSNNNTFIVQGDQGNVNDLKKLDIFESFDIIIDDGSHESKDQIASFEYLYPKLNKGGYYFIEDLASPRNDEFTEYIKKRNDLGKVDTYKSISPEARIMCVEK